MALYAYRAFKRDGTAVSGTMDATSIAEVRERLQRSGLLPAIIERSTHAATGTWAERLSSLFIPRVTSVEVIFFTKQLAVLLKAGVPLVQSLELLIEQTEKGLQRIVIDLKDGLKEGRSLADGLQNYPALFDTTYVQLVRAGEASGRLEQILDRLVIHLERSQALRTKIRGALSMPLIQLAAVLVVVGILLTFVIPQMEGVFAAQKVLLPVSTRVMLALSHLIRDHTILLLVILITLVGSFMWWKSTESGARVWDKIKLRLPLVGYFVRMGAVVQFCSTLGMLIEGGVNLAESLTIVCRIIDNKILIDALTAARDKIIKQGKITIYLKETGLFPPIALHLIKTGEESGQLAQMLLTVADTFDQEVREAADSLTDKLQPVMTLVMGAIVGFVVMAIGGPMMKLGDIAGAQVKGFK